LGVSGETNLKNLLFSFQGRINRAKFWLFTIAAAVIYCVAMGILGGGAMSSSDPPRRSSRSAWSVASLRWCS
jgi:uncharacterized membrane protein YhaH (DUF805 family)